MAGRVGIENDDAALGLTGLGRSGRLALAYLVSERHRPVSRDELADALWGEDLPRSWEQMLRGLVSRLRLKLGEAGLVPSEALVTAFGAYQLRLPADAVVDVEEAVANRDAATDALLAGDAARTFDLATAAASVASRQFVPGATGAWMERRQAELRELHLSALELVSRSSAALGRAPEAVAAAEEAIAIEPFRESAYICLMGAHTAAGNRGEALRAYERCRLVLAEELGVSPSSPTEEAYLGLLGEESSPHPVFAAAAVIPLPAALLPTSDSFFVGRESELEELGRALKRMAAEGRQAVLLAGEAGIGKTTLVGSIARQAHAEGARVLYGRCDEELVSPYQPFAEALSHLVAHLDLTELAAHVDAHGSDVARVAPEFARRLPDAAPPPPTDPEADRYRLFESVAALLAGASERAPMMLVLDDLHWATSATLQLLRHVLRATSSARLLVVGTYRHTEVSDMLADVLADLRREPWAVHRMRLEGLDTDGVIALMESLGGTSGGEEALAQAEAVRSHTGGNPFFVGELLRHLTETGAVYRRRAPWSYYVADDDLDVPRGVQEVVERRLRRLSAAASATVVCASVVGVEFELEVLERVADVEDAFDAVEEAIGAHVLVELSPGRYRFSHAIVRDTVYAGLTATRRGRLHRRAGEAVEALPSIVDRQRLAALVHHFAAAASAGCAMKAADYALAAARQAIGEATWEEAAALLERGLAALDAQPSPDVERRCELLLLLAETWTRFFDPDRMMDAAARALDAARALGRPQPLGRAVYWRLRFLPLELTASDYQTALVHEGLNALGDSEPGLRAKILAVGAQGADPSVWIPTAREAVAIARRCGDYDALGMALWSLAGALRGSPHAEEYLAVSEELVTSVRPGLWDGWRTGHDFRALGRLVLGDRDGFEEDVAACERVGVEGRFWFFRWTGAMRQATIALLDGRFSEVEGLAQKAFEVARNRGRPFLLRQVFRLHYERGDAEPAAEVATELVEKMPEGRTNTIHVGMLAVARTMQDVGKHRAWLEAFADEDVAAWKPERVPVTLAYQVEVVAALGAATTAERLYETLLPYHDQIVIGGMGDGCQGAVDRFLGILGWLLGRPDQAESYFETALALEAGLRSPPLVARTSYWYGRMLLGRGDGAARSLLDASFQTADRLGMRALAADARALLDGA